MSELSGTPRYQASLPELRTGSLNPVMGRVYRFETSYLDAVRLVLVIAIIFGVLAVGGAFVWYVGAHLTTAGTHHSSDYFEAPTWGLIRPSVLPAAAEQAGTQKGPAVPCATPAPGQRSVDQRIECIAENLNAQFARNTGDEAGFTDRYPKRLLEAWVFEDAELPPQYLAGYIDELIAVSRAVGGDGQINRIASLDDRARVIMQALQAFRLAFLERLEQARQQAATANAVAAQQRAEAEQVGIFLGFGGLGLLVIFTLILVLLRIEVHLRSSAHGRLGNQGLAKAEHRDANFQD